MTSLSQQIQEDRLKKVWTEHTCPVCGKKFEGKASRKYCSCACSASATNNWKKKTSDEEVVDEAFSVLANQPSIRDLLEEMREDIHELRQQLNRIEAGNYRTSTTGTYIYSTGTVFDLNDTAKAIQRKLEEENESKRIY
jgi:RNA polymerase-binding transcription factor DksA